MFLLYTARDEGSRAPVKAELPKKEIAWPRWLWPRDATEKKAKHTETTPTAAHALANSNNKEPHRDATALV